VCCVGDNILIVQEYDDCYPCPSCVRLQSKEMNVPQSDETEGDRFGESGEGDGEANIEEPLWFGEPTM
jgi:hypothetical protein